MAKDRRLGVPLLHRTADMGVCENFPSGPLREYAHAGGGAHQAVERLWVGPDLSRQLVSRFGSGVEEVRDSELGEAGHRARDVDAAQELEYADMGRGRRGLFHHFFHRDFDSFGFGAAGVYLNGAPRFSIVLLRLSLIDGR